VNNEVASTSLLTITAGVSIFNSFCPPLHEVRRATGKDNGIINDTRVAEIAAVSLTVAIGMIGSGLTKSPVPGVLAILAAAALVAMYEGVLRTQPTENK